MIVGIDFSTHAIDLVALDDDGTPTWHHHPLIGFDAFERARNVRDAMPARGSVFWDDIVAVGIEEPQGAQRATVAKLKAIQGGILACIPARILVQPWQPSQWRGAVGLPGSCSKETVAGYVGASLFGFVPLDNYVVAPTITIATATWTQDACDAYCIARATATRIEEHAA